MSEPITVRVFEIVGNGFCVASDDGQKVHDQIAIALRESRKVELSFLNVDSLTSAFLNAAIGQLYGEFSEEQIKAGLSVKDMSNDDLALLKRVVDTAKQYFKDPERFKKAREEVLEDGDDSQNS
jgi:hypothetical protein